MRQIYPYSIRNGYIYIKAKALHRILMERILKRRLSSNEIIHHVNYDKADNSTNNLLLTDRSKHTKSHIVTGYSSAIPLSKKAKLEFRAKSADVWIMKKTKKGKDYFYYAVSFRIGKKVKNVHIGSINKMTRDEAVVKAKEIKKSILLENFNEEKDLVKK